MIYIVALFLIHCRSLLGLPWWLSGKESTCNAGNVGSIAKETPWRRKWQLTPVFLPGESHGRRSLAGYSPRGHKESDTIEQLNNSSSLLEK